jgi:hypothetical protein
MVFLTCTKGLSINNNLMFVINGGNTVKSLKGPLDAIVMF